MRQCRHDRRGVVLPLVILWISLLAVGMTAGLSRLSAERRTQANLDAEVDAVTLAQIGLDRYFSGVSSQPGALETVTYSGLPGGGSATVTVRRIRAGSGSVQPLWVIQSHANHTGAVRYDATTPAAQRTVAQFATWVSGSMNVPAAWTSITGLKKNGNSGDFYGTDQCTTPPAPAPTVAAIAVPTNTSAGGVGYDGPMGPLRSNPQIGNLGANPTAAAAGINIDWAGIVASEGAILNPTHIYTAPSYPGTAGLAMPGNPGYDNTTWRTVVVNNYNFTTNTALNAFTMRNGRGLLVVTGNLTMNMNNNTRWEGVILVGGTVTGGGTNNVYGAIISGLNTKLGITVPLTDLAGGTKDIRYNSCFVTQALSGLGGLVPIANAKADNWPVY